MKIYNITNIHIKSIYKTAGNVFPIKTLHPGGIRTQIFYSLGGCVDFRATPPRPGEENYSTDAV
jgi:hypothetical protein